MKTFTTEILDAEDGSGDGIIQFPDEFIKEQDWREGDRIDMKVEDGCLILRNIDKAERESLHKQVP